MRLGVPVPEQRRVLMTLRHLIRLLIGSLATLLTPVLAPGAAALLLSAAWPRRQAVR